MTFTIIKPPKVGWIDFSVPEKQYKKLLQNQMFSVVIFTFFAAFSGSGGGAEVRYAASSVWRKRGSQCCCRQ